MKLALVSNRPLGHVQRVSPSRLFVTVFAESTPSKPRDGGPVASRDDGEGMCSEAQRMALYGSASRVDCALGSRVGALGFWFLCARGRAHRCGTGFGAEDLDAVAASSTQAYAQHKLLRKFTDLYARSNHHPALPQPRAALRRKCSSLRVASDLSAQGTLTRQRWPRGHVGGASSAQ